MSTTHGATTREEAPVTVLMATYNRARYLPEALASVLGQTRPPAQVIVVDDGSTDDTQAAMAGFGDRLLVLQKSNGGKSSALNLGMKQVRGEYVWIFDDDDVALPHALESQLELLARRPEADFVYSRHFRGRDGSGPSIEIIGSATAPEHPDAELFVRLLGECTILQQGMLVPARCFREVGPYREDFIRSQDYEMNLRLSRRYRGVLNRRETFIRREHAGTCGSKDQPVAARQRAAAWARHDAKIAEHYLAVLGLPEYIGQPATHPLGPGDERRARVARASIMARKGLWTVAIADLHAASRIPAGALDDGEREALRLVLEPIYYEAFVPLIKARRLRESLRRALPETALGRAMRQALADGWSQTAAEAVAEGDWKFWLRLVELFAGVFGVRGVIDEVAGASRG